MFGCSQEVKEKPGFSGVFAADLRAVSDGDGPFRAQSFKILSRLILHAKSAISERGMVTVVSGWTEKADAISSQAIVSKRALSWHVIDRCLTTRG
jgi:hypothetical protein